MGLKNIAKNRFLIFIPAAAFLVLAVIELILNLCSAVFPGVNAFFRPRGIVERHIEDRTLGVTPNPDFPGHDKHGFRNKLVPEKVSLVCMGDSRTYGAAVSEANSWPEILSRISGISTYNMAYGGYGPAHGLLLFDKAAGLKPKMIIGAFYSGNGFYHAYSLVYDRDSLSGMRTGDPLTMIDIEKAEKIMPLEEKMLYAHGDPGYKSVCGPRPLFLDKFKTYRLAKAAVISINKNLGYLSGYARRKSRWDLIKEKAVDKKIYQTFDNGKVRTVFTPAYRLCGLDNNDPRIREGVRIIKDSLNALKEKAGAGEIDFLVLLIPTKELAFRRAVYSQYDFEDISSDYRKLVEKEEGLRRELKDFLETSEIGFIDTLPVLSHLVERGVQIYPLTSDGNFNRIGNYVIADAVSRYIKEHADRTR